MQSWGVTRSGKARYHCPRCHCSTLRRRPDHAEKSWQRRFVAWLTQGYTQSQIAQYRQVSRATVQRRFRACWAVCPQPRQPTGPLTTLVVDATHVVTRHCSVLIAQDCQSHRPLGWHFAPSESYLHWVTLLAPIQALAPRFVVCDGHPGLLKALRTVWPTILVQRCLIHVVRQARLWLTQHPKTPAAQKLLTLVRALPAVRTRRQRRRWLRAWRSWCRHYETFLKERTHHPTASKRWWYTHRKLRAVRALIARSVPDLFRYTRYPELPRTTNHVEGGINSRLKDLYRRHRGLSPERKVILTAWYLAIRQGQKPTQNEY